MKPKRILLNIFMLYHPFPLKCIKLIQTFTKEYMDQFNTEKIYSKNIPLSPDIVSILTDELKEYNIPLPANFLCFKRRGFKRVPITHVDGTASGIAIKASLVIPIEGTENSVMYWYTGNYSLITEFTAEGHPYNQVRWHKIPNFLDEVEISDTPMLCAVDVPHCATSSPTGEYRTILSIRFKENPSIEELVSLRFKKG